MSIRFDVIENGHFPNGAVVYRDNEFSFDVEPVPTRGLTSFLLNDLSLEVDKDGNLISIWGLCPYPAWRRGEIQLPNPIRAAVKIRTDLPILGGISISLNHGDRWPILYDKESGWILIRKSRKGDVFVEFLAGAILGISTDGELNSLWLKAKENLDIRQ